MNELKTKEIELRRIHQESIHMLSDYFKPLNMYFFGRRHKITPIPTIIKIVNNEFGMANIGYENGSTIININERKHNSVIDLETSVVHETGHYLHILKLGDYKKFDRVKYSAKEIIAIASCFIYFEIKNRSNEFKNHVQNLDLGYISHERVLLKLIESGITPEEILQKAMKENRSLLELYEKYIEEEDIHCVERMRMIKKLNQSHEISI